MVAPLIIATMSLIHIPETPIELGMPSKFKQWRHNQKKSIEDFFKAVDDKKKFIGQMQTVGSGKSLTYMSIAKLLGGRCAILTATKGLEQQLVDDFASIGLVDIKGKSNYQCDEYSTKTCEEGILSRCVFRSTTCCPWHASRTEAMGSDSMVTNYACWISANKYGNAFGDFDLLVLDECQMAYQYLTAALQIQLTEHDMYDVTQYGWPDPDLFDMCSERDQKMEIWKEWAKVGYVRAKMLWDEVDNELKDTSRKPRQESVNRYKQLTNIVRKLADLACCKTTDWVHSSIPNGFQFDILKPAKFADKYLYHGAKVVLFTSGSLHRKSLYRIGVPPAKLAYAEYSLTPKPDRSPLIYIPTAKVDKNTQPWEMKRVVKRIDEIIESRGDRKGIIHSVSNHLRDFILEHSEYRDYMVTNYAQNGDVTAEIVREFKRMSAPRVLVSASIGVGYDFAHGAARYQILPKLPFGDRSSEIEKARDEEDRMRGIHDTWDRITQVFGRGDRGEDDWCELFILDENFTWMIERYSHLSNSWLLSHVKKLKDIPIAPVLTGDDMSATDSLRVM